MNLMLDLSKIPEAITDFLFNAFDNKWHLLFLGLLVVIGLILIIRSCYG